MIKNLGQVAAIYVGKTAPRNANMIWLDNTVVPYVFKAYNGIEWAEIPTGAWIEAYVNGWLVSLQQGTVTADEDYMLINSGGVNYKMTVKDFVKSSVGNPLDFKGVIRTDADFPNPSTLESGDMYVIITDPAGGTVTDPYSKKTFSDSEKIVWDSVVNSWESLGKIDVKVDLSTTYSATEVTIHSSAGKETTVVGVTDDNAGVMVPIQKKWLDSLSDGSTLTPQGPSTDPYHKHRYMDIVDRIISQQSTGESTTNPMSQKATTDALDLKLDKDAIVQVSGVATDKIMSQKAVTDAISTAIGNVDLSDYLPLSGGTMSGRINSTAEVILGIDNKNFLYKEGNSIGIGSYVLNKGIYFLTSQTDLFHYRKRTDSSGDRYIIHDAYNLPDPAKLSTDQTFTGNNNFTAGKFNVTGDKSKFSVNDVGGLRMYYDYADDETGISRYLDFYTKTSSDTDYARRGIFGLYASKSTPNSDYAYIGAGDVELSDAQYRFYPSVMKVPDVWSMSVNSGSALLEANNANIYLAASNKNTRIRSNDSDLYHRKTTTSATTDYKIWDASNLPSPASSSDLANYLPLSGGNMSGNIVLDNDIYLNTKDTDGNILNLVSISSNNIVRIGSANHAARIYSNASDLNHFRGATGYKIYDSYNLPYPVQTSDLADYVVKSDLDAYATKTWIGEQNYLVESDLASYATQSWVEGKGYLTANSLDGYATESWVENKGYLTEASLDTYAKKTDLDSYLPLAGGTMTGNLNIANNKNISSYKKDGSLMNVAYINESDVLVLGNVGLDVTISSSYSDLIHKKSTGEYKIWDASNLSNPATQSWVEEKGYLTTTSLDGYATESWVNSKNYLTSAALTGYATEEWVEAKNYITAADIPSITITSSGNGNAVTAITASGHVLTVTKGATYLTSASLSGYATEKWVTDKNYLTSDSLSGYATEEWASGQFPSKTGTGASGSWAIDITGNAATSTNSTQLGGVAAASYATQQWVIDNFSAGGEASKLLLSDNTWSGTNTYKKNVVLDNNIKLVSSKTDGTSVNLIQEDSSDNLIIGNGSAVRIYGEGDLKHYKGSSAYTIYDTANLIDPATKQWVDEQGYITTDALSGYATEDWVTGKGYLTSSSLTGYATEKWVTDKGYLTSSDLTGYAKTSDLEGYATQQWVEGKGYITSSSLTGYATEEWVNGKGYLTSSSLEGYATEAWVEAKKYLTQASLTGYATQTWVTDQGYITGEDIPPIVVANSGEGNAVTSITATGHALTVTKGATYLTSSDLNGYATEKWVTDKGYLTSDDLTSYATEQWVKDQNYLTNADVTVTVTGTGNAITNITAEGRVITATKGATYLTQSSLTGYATQKWVQDQSYLTSSSLTGYAKESWVEEQGYLTDASLTGYATESWVESKNYLTSSSLDGYAKTTDLDSYLKRSGNNVTSPVTGDIFFSNDIALKWIIPGESPSEVLKVDSSNVLRIGEGADISKIKIFGDSDIIHTKGATDYKIWDASNIAKPVNYNEGTESTVTTIYNRNLGVNGNQWTFLSYTNASTTNIYAPTTAGTSGQVLQSQGTGKAPTWVDFSGGGVQLSDDNVWTGLNTFQGGLKTSDGTTSYDVWDSNNLTFPVRYINTSDGYSLQCYSRTASWNKIDFLPVGQLIPNNNVYLTSGGHGYVGLSTNAYNSAAISEINTNKILFGGLSSNVLSANSDGELEYGSSSNYANFNSGDIRIAYPTVSSSGGGGGGGGGTTDSSEGGLTIGYYPVNTKGKVTERAKIYCTTANLYLKDLAKNTQLDFDADGLYVTTGSTSKVRLATLNDVSGGGGSSVSLDSDNTWTGTNIFQGSSSVIRKYDSGNNEVPADANYNIQLACGGSYSTYAFGASLSTERFFGHSYAYIQTPSGFFKFDDSGSLTTTISGTNYEFWNKNNLTKPVTYTINSDGEAVLQRGDSSNTVIDGLILQGLRPNDDTANILQGGAGGFGTAEHAYAESYIGAMYTNEIHTYTDNDMTVTVNLTMDNDGVYFTDSNGTTYKLTMEQVS